MNMKLDWYKGLEPTQCGDRPLRTSDSGLPQRKRKSHFIFHEINVSLRFHQSVLYQFNANTRNHQIIIHVTDVVPYNL